MWGIGLHGPEGISSNPSWSTIGGVTRGKKRDGENLWVKWCFCRWVLRDRDTLRPIKEGGWGGHGGKKEWEKGGGGETTVIWKSCANQKGRSEEPKNGKVTTDRHGPSSDPAL